MTYEKFLDVKKAVLEEDATIMYVADNLQITTLMARCLVKDWKETNEFTLEGEQIAELIYKWADEHHIHPDDFDSWFVPELLVKLEEDK